MGDEYLLIILLCYIIYPLSIYDLFNILFLNEKSDTLFKDFIISIMIYISSFMSNETGLFVWIIESITPYLIIAYLITYVVIFIRFIINKIKNKSR